MLQKFFDVVGRRKISRKGIEWDPIIMIIEKFSDDMIMGGTPCHNIWINQDM